MDDLKPPVISGPPGSGLYMQIDALVELGSKIQGIRQYSTQLLRDQGSDASSLLGNDFAGSLGLTQSKPDLLRRHLQELKEFGDVVKSEEIQTALKAARKGEKEAKGASGTDIRRDQRKRKRGPSPGAPSPFPTFQQKHSSWPYDGQSSPLLPGGVLSYLRTFREHDKTCKLQIWSPSRSLELAPGSLPNPLMLRFTIPEVMFVYIRFERHQEDEPLVIENATVFGSREKKPPHMQSEFTVFLTLSQQLANVLQKHPRLHLPQLMDLLLAYKGLFTDRCTRCERVLAIEGHLPPVARLWVEPGPTAPESDKGKWEPRHLACIQR